jgi:hypothetical protein
MALMPRDRNPLVWVVGGIGDGLPESPFFSDSRKVFQYPPLAENSSNIVTGDT